MAGPARTFDDVTECVEQTSSRIGKRVVAALLLDRMQLTRTEERLWQPLLVQELRGIA